MVAQLQPLHWKMETRRLEIQGQLGLHSKSEASSGDMRHCSLPPSPRETIPQENRSSIAGWCTSQNHLSTAALWMNELQRPQSQPSYQSQGHSKVMFPSIPSNIQAQKYPTYGRNCKTCTWERIHAIHDIPRSNLGQFTLNMLYLPI